MKLPRYIVTASAALATLCGIAIAALWAWTNGDPSHHHFESTIIGNLDFTANAQLLGLDYATPQRIIEPPLDPPDLPQPRPFNANFHLEYGFPDTHLGFSIGTVHKLTHVHYDLTSNKSDYINHHFFLAPYWVCIPMLLSFPLLLLSRRRRTTRPGICPKCHYDLRAHAPDSLCPECGTPVTSQCGAGAPTGISRGNIVTERPASDAPAWRL